MRLLLTLALSGWFAGCNTVSNKSSPDSPAPKTPAPLAQRAPDPPPPAAPAPPPLPDGLEQAEGQVAFVEKSGDNLYVEIAQGGQTVGVELLPAVARRFAGKIKKGEPLAVRGKRLKGSKEIAFVIEVSDPAHVGLGGTFGGSAQMASVRLPTRFPAAPVEMIAAHGMWPPVDSDEIKKRVTSARADRATRMVVDTGLTELYRAYEDPSAFLDVVGRAAAEARRQGVSTAFYFPAFEIRREKGSRSKQPLARWKPGWPQHTLSGKPFIKTAFDKEEFWNREGDEVLWACPNTAWREVFISRMEQAVKKGARTLFIDVPYFQVAGKQMTCRCNRCQARFKRETGKAIPTAIRRDGEAYRRWIWWRHRVLADFFRELKRRIRAVDPRARLVVEEFPGYVDQATTNTGVDIGLIGDEVDLFAHEYSAKQFDKKPFSAADRLELAATLALYRGLDDRRPTWVLSYAHNAAGSRISAALHLAYDASFWETKGPEMNDTTVGRAWRRKLFSWFAKHRALFGDSRQIASVALLYSPASRDFTADHFTTLMSAVRGLIRAGIPLRVLSTRDLDQLGDYAALVLPSVEALSDDEAAKLRAFRGQLLVLGRPPSRGELGLRTRDHRLRYRKVTVAGLAAAVTSPLQVSGGPVAANLVARRGELQLRLAALRPTATVVTVKLPPPGKVTSASTLTLLGDERPLALSPGSDGSLSIPLKVKDLTLVRLRLQ